MGGLLRDGRQRRRLSQLNLAISADVSIRHLSFVETERSQPSRQFVIHLAEHLEVPLRERNAVLRVSLNPGGRSPRIVNFTEWAEHLLERLDRQIVVSGDPELVALLRRTPDLPGRHRPSAIDRPQQPVVRPDRGPAPRP